jgi:hypothetical protein
VFSLVACGDDADGFIQKIVIDDETWVHQYDQESKQWHEKGVSAPRNFKMTQSVWLWPQSLVIEKRYS